MWIFFFAKAAFFSQGSPRGRFKLVRKVAKARLKGGRICKELYDKIAEACDDARKAANRRNDYSHNKLSFMRDGKVELQNAETIADPLKKLRHPPTEIDKATDSIRSLSKRVFQLMVACMEKPFDAPMRS